MSKVVDCGDFELSIKITVGIHARPETINSTTKEALAPMAERIAGAVDLLEAAALEVVAEDLGLTPDVRDPLAAARVEHLKKKREAEESGRAAKAAKRAGAR